MTGNEMSVDLPVFCEYECFTFPSPPYTYISEDFYYQLGYVSFIISIIMDYGGNNLKIMKYLKILLYNNINVNVNVIFDHGSFFKR